jgi:hypothetical protein
VEYAYDLGDGWAHRIRVEQIVDPEPGGRYPVCLGGERACPPEECGGPAGYGRLLATLADPADAHHEETREWLGLEPGREFEPERFDLDEANRRIRSASLDASAVQTTTTIGR